MKPREGVIAKMVGAEMVLLDYDRGIYYGLNGIGARVWQLLAGGATIDEVIARLTDEYDVARATLEADVAALLRDLEAKELVD
jgi:Coenzyme PQQ synthesis protein D (PqqD)